MNILIKKLASFALALCLTATGLQAMCWSSCCEDVEEDAITVASGDRALVQQLLRASDLRGKLLKKDEREETLLMKASSFGFKDAVSYILRVATHGHFVHEVLHAQDRQGRTALMKAALCGNVDVVSLILDAARSDGCLSTVLSAEDITPSTALFMLNIPGSYNYKHKHVVWLIAQAMVEHVATTQFRDFRQQLRSLFPNMQGAIARAYLLRCREITEFLTHLWEGCETLVQARDWVQRFRIYSLVGNRTPVPERNHVRFEPVHVEDLRAPGNRTHA